MIRSCRPAWRGLAAVVGHGGGVLVQPGLDAIVEFGRAALLIEGGDIQLHVRAGSGFQNHVAVQGIGAAAVKAALPGVTYTGVTGDIAFDDIGDAIRDTAFIKTADTANGVWALETVQTASAIG